jgi:hypothetical protein
VSFTATTTTTTKKKANAFEPMASRSELLLVLVPEKRPIPQFLPLRAPHKL